MSTSDYKKNINRGYVFKTGDNQQRRGSVHLEDKKERDHEGHEDHDHDHDHNHNQNNDHHHHHHHHRNEERKETTTIARSEKHKSADKRNISALSNEPKWTSGKKMLKPREREFLQWKERSLSVTSVSSDSSAHNMSMPFSEELRRKRINAITTPTAMSLSPVPFPMLQIQSRHSQSGHNLLSFSSSAAAAAVAKATTTTTTTMATATATGLPSASSSLSSSSSRIKTLSTGRLADLLFVSEITNEKKKMENRFSRYDFMPEFVCKRASCQQSLGLRTSGALRDVPLHLGHNSPHYHIIVYVGLLGVLEYCSTCFTGTRSSDPLNDFSSLSLLVSKQDEICADTHPLQQIPTTTVTATVTAQSTFQTFLHKLVEEERAKIRQCMKECCENYEPNNTSETQHDANHNSELSRSDAKESATVIAQHDLHYADSRAADSTSNPPKLLPSAKIHERQCPHAESSDDCQLFAQVNVSINQQDLLKAAKCSGMSKDLLEDIEQTLQTNPVPYGVLHLSFFFFFGNISELNKPIHVNLEDYCHVHFILYRPTDGVVEFCHECRRVQKKITDSPLTLSDRLIQKVLFNIGITDRASFVSLSTSLHRLKNFHVSLVKKIPRVVNAAGNPSNRALSTSPAIRATETNSAFSMTMMTIADDTNHNMTTTSAGAKKRLISSKKSATGTSNENGGSGKAEESKVLTFHRRAVHENDEPSYPQTFGLNLWYSYGQQKKTQERLQRFQQLRTTTTHNKHDHTHGHHGRHDPHGHHAHHHHHHHHHRDHHNHNRNHNHNRPHPHHPQHHTNRHSHHPHPHQLHSHQLHPHHHPGGHHDHRSRHPHHHNNDNSTCQNDSKHNNNNNNNNDAAAAADADAANNNDDQNDDSYPISWLSLTTVTRKDRDHMMRRMAKAKISRKAQKILLDMAPLPFQYELPQPRASVLKRKVRTQEEEMERYLSGATATASTTTTTGSIKSTSQKKKKKKKRKKKSKHPSKKKHVPPIADDYTSRDSS
ncbi:hypothetical protein RFI_16193, partial [Reticulomyxa filosa]